MDNKSPTQKLNEYLKNSKNRSYFIGLVTVVFVMLMVFLGILPAYTAFSEQGVENQKRADVIAKLSAKRDALQSLTLESQEKETLVNYFSQVFPSTANQEILLNTIIELAERSQVYLANLDFNENTDILKDFPNLILDPALQSLKLQIKLEGTQQSINAFIAEIEKERRLMNIKAAIISRKPEQDLIKTTPDKYYDLNMQINVYYFLDNVDVEPIL